MMSSPIASLFVLLMIFLMLQTYVCTPGLLSSSKFKRNWQPILPVTLPKPDDSGITISNINHYENDEDEVFDVTSKYNHIGSYHSVRKKIKLAAGHRCHLNHSNLINDQQHHQCQDNLQCRTLPGGPNVMDYGICTLIDCSPNCQNFWIKCPSDSVPMLKVIENDGQRCCFRFCVCDEKKCVENKEKCSRGYHKLEEAKGMPGKCCDRIECYPFIHKNCTGNDDRTYDSGKSWLRSEDCHLCKCIDGVWKCEEANNCPLECLPANSSIPLKPGQCCHPCKGCIHDGNKYEHLQTWLDNDCRRCECKNEKYVCDYEFGGPKYCERPCTKYERREWQKDKCCDKCECNLHCPYGLKVDSTNGNNSPLCQCRDGPFDGNDHQQKQILRNNMEPTSRSFERNTQLNDSHKKDTRTDSIEPIWFYMIAVTSLIIIILPLAYYFYVRSKSSQRTSQCNDHLNTNYQPIKTNEDNVSENVFHTLKGDRTLDGKQEYNNEMTQINGTCLPIDEGSK